MTLSKRFAFHKVKPAFFEGVYYKIITSSHKPLVLIPGFASGKDKHAFVQVFDGVDYHYIRYGISEYQKTTSGIKIGDNHFSIDNVQLNIKDDALTLHGQLKLDSHTPWPAVKNAMGPFAFISFMECYYDILSFRSTPTGSLTMNGTNIDFTNGRAYLEKNWGKSFPQKWIWGQCQHFDEEGLSLTLSVARIPFLGFHFLGFMSAFSYQGKVYRFTTYNNSRIKEFVNGNENIEIVFTRKKNELRLVCDKSKFVLLNAPRMGNMTAECFETLDAKIELSFYQKGKLQIKSVGRPAGLEINPLDFSL